MPDQRQYAGYSIKELPKVNTDDEGKVLAVVKGKWDKSGSQIELPIVSSDDNGKVLGVTEGAWNKMDAPTELPAVTNEDNGRILQVSNGEWTKQNMPTELPAVTVSDNGKALGVSGGSWTTVYGVPSASSSDLNKVLSVSMETGPGFTKLYVPKWKTLPTYTETVYQHAKLTESQGVYTLTPIQDYFDWNVFNNTIGSVENYKNIVLVIDTEEVSELPERAYYLELSYKTMTAIFMYDFMSWVHNEYHMPQDEFKYFMIKLDSYNRTISVLSKDITFS